MESDPDFLGPQALAKAMRFAGDPRDGTKLERLEQVNGKHGDLGVHALLLLQRALPEGRRPARRDRQARRRVDQGGHRPRHGREAREVVRQLGAHDRLAARDGARAEDAGHRRVDPADALRAQARARRQGADAVPAARREERARVARASTTSCRSRAAAATPGSSRASARSRARERPSRGRARPVRRGLVPAAEAARKPRRRSVECDRDGGEASRLLQGLPRVAVGEGARHRRRRRSRRGSASSSRSSSRSPAAAPATSTRRSPDYYAAPERAHPLVRRRDRLRHAAHGLQRLHAEPAPGELAAASATPSCARA